MQGNEIEINGKRFGIEGTIGMEMNNPFFDRDTFRWYGSYAFSKNADADFLKALGNPHLLQARERTFSVQDVKLFSKGRKLFNGVLFINSINHQLNTQKVKLSLTLGDDKNNFTDKIAGKTIKDLNISISIPNPDEDDFDPVDFLDGGYTEVCNTPTTDWASNVVNNGHDYVCFPSVYHENFVYGKTYTNQIINHWNDSANELTKMDVTRAGDCWVDIVNGDNPEWRLINGIMPMFYYKKVLQHCFSDFGYNLTGEILSSGYFDDMVVVNMRSCVKPRFLSIRPLGPISNIFRRYDELSTTISAREHLPAVSIADFVRDFLITFNCAVEIKGTEARIIQYQGKTSPVAYDKYSPEIFIERNEAKTLKLAYQWSDLEVSTLYDKLKEDKVLRSSLPDYLDYTNSATEADQELANIKIYNKICKVLGGEAIAANVVMDNFIPYYSGEDVTYTPVLSPLCMSERNYTVSPSSGNECYLPTVNRPYHVSPFKANTYVEDADTPGTINYELSDFETLEMFLQEEFTEVPSKAFYHGLQNTLSSYEYPYMSSHNYMPDATTKLRPYHLGWLGEEGLYEMHWKNTQAVFNAPGKVSIKMSVPENIVLEHTFSTDIIVRSRRYYVAAIKFEAPYEKQPVYECYEIL